MARGNEGVENKTRWELGTSALFKGVFREQGRLKESMSKNQEDPWLPGAWPTPGLGQDELATSCARKQGNVRRTVVANPKDTGA